MGKRRAQNRPGEDEDDCINDPLFFSPGGASYNEMRDGPLGEYLRTHDGYNAFPLFKGIDDFEMLRQQGWLEPRISVIRLMYNVGRDDGHYVVTEDFKLEGLQANAHSGDEGIFEPAELLKDAPPFEGHHLRGPAWKKYTQEEEDRLEREYNEQNPS